MTEGLGRSRTVRAEAEHTEERVGTKNAVLELRTLQVLMHVHSELLKAPNESAHLRRLCFG